MIDEKKLIYDICNHDIDIPDSITYNSTNELNAFILGLNAKQIAVMEDIKNSPKVGEWIPVSEGLPKENGTYLVTWEMRESKSRFTGSLFFLNGEWGTVLDTCDVVAWQPKPEPWRGE